MFKRFATAAGILLAFQVSSAAAGPCDYDAKHDKTVQPELGQAKEAKAHATVKARATEMAAKPAEAAAAVKLAKADVPAKPAAPEAAVKLAKAEPANQAKVDAAEPEKAEVQVVRRGGGNRRGLTPAALALLDRIESEFGPVNVISGYRPGARIAGSGRISRHASGNAIDLEAGSRKGAIVKWLVANHQSGGTMTYASMSHIHVDIGQHFVSLGSGSGRGRRVARSRNRAAARYAEAGYARRDYDDDRRDDGYDRRDDGYDRRDYGYGRRSNGYERRSRTARTYQGQRYASGYATIYQ
jgi:uncharacterized protein YcbK (DUF882 family)